MTIKDVEKQTGFTAKSIRYYEEKGLIRIERNAELGLEIKAVLFWNMSGKDNSIIGSMWITEKSRSTRPLQMKKLKDMSTTAI